ncbi:MAG: hypothetical protein JO165_00605 [Candidatus Eremiobacteraeota bacterium]|nr:hypothetical protein [Candidatus Eremiobacteraeota bacterium]
MKRMDGTPKSGLLVTGLPDVSLSPRIPRIAKFVISDLSRRANDSISRAASEYGAATVDLYSLSLRDADKKGSLLSRDGMHPNDHGYQRMAEAAYPAIANLLGERH